MKKLDEVVKAYSDSYANLSMVCQYAELVDPELEGPSNYNYFKHGNDGMIWDCIQIIGLARQAVLIQETSPIWQCTINGQRINIQNMDRAYVENVRKWVSGQYMSLERIYEFHKKTHDYDQRQNHKGSNWYSSPEYVHTIS
jgi:hypothetical protein